MGGASGMRTQHVILARDNSAPAAAPIWCSASDSNRPLRAFNARQSPDLLTGHLARTTRVELVSPRWRRGILPLNYVRADGGQPANRTPRGIAAGFTDPLTHQTC